MAESISRRVLTYSVTYSFWMILVVCHSVHGEISDVPCESNITLEIGKQEIVRCSFQHFTFLGWFNGSDPKTSTPFIYLENSEKKGKGYDSGEYDILPDGSLIINNVTLEDECNCSVLYVPRERGRIIYKVPVRVFDPDPPCDTNMYLEIGKQGTVRCSFQNFTLLGWINGSDPKGSTPFIYLENSVKKGRGYYSGEYDILPDGSLIINNVELKDECVFTVHYVPPVGEYINYKVPVRVLVYPVPYYPVVNGLTNQQYIVHDVKLYSAPINCTMNGVRPRIELELVYQSDVISMERERSSIVSNTDGTYNTTLSSRYTIRDRSVSRITLQCRVAGEMADLFPSVTTLYLLLNKHFPKINGEANQQHLVLQLNREDEVTCSLDRVLHGASLEWVILSPKDEVALESETSKIDNGDGTFNITLNSRFTMIGQSVRHVILQCGVSSQAGYMYPDVTTVVLLSDSFPVVNGQARQQHLVLYLKRQAELNCSVYRVSKGVSLEMVIVNSELSSEITFKDDVTVDDNGDGTSNVTLASSFNVMSSSVQHVTFQCRVSGRGANLYPDVTTIDILISDSTSSPNMSRWSFDLNTLILCIGLVVIFVVLVLMLLKTSKRHTVYVPEDQADTAVLRDRREYEEIEQEPGDRLDQQSQEEGTSLGDISGEEALRKRLLDRKSDNVASGSSSYGINTATTEM